MAAVGSDNCLLTFAGLRNHANNARQVYTRAPDVHGQPPLLRVFDIKVPLVAGKLADESILIGESRLIAKIMSAQKTSESMALINTQLLAAGYLSFPEGRGCPYISPVLGVAAATDGTRALFYERAGGTHLEDLSKDLRAAATKAHKELRAAGKEAERLGEDTVLVIDKELVDKAVAAHALLWDRARVAAVCLLKALKELHSRGVWHKDIKLDNAMFDEDLLMARLIDFDIASLPGHPAVNRFNWAVATPELARCTIAATKAAEEAAAAGPSTDAQEKQTRKKEEKEGFVHTAGGDIWQLAMLLLRFVGKVPPQLDWSKLARAVQLKLQHEAQTTGQAMPSNDVVMAQTIKELCHNLVSFDMAAYLVRTAGKMEDGFAAFLAPCFAADPQDRPSAADLLEDPYLNQKHATRQRVEHRELMWTPHLTTQTRRAKWVAQMWVGEAAAEASAVAAAAAAAAAASAVPTVAAYEVVSTISSTISSSSSSSSSSASSGGVVTPTRAESCGQLVTTPSTPTISSGRSSDAGTPATPISSSSSAGHPSREAAGRSVWGRVRRAAKVVCKGVASVVKAGCEGLQPSSKCMCPLVMMMG